MSYPAPPPQPGWYPDPSGGPGQRYFDGHEWSLSAPPPLPSGVVDNPGSGPNNALHLALTLLTCGMWLPVWLVLAINDNRHLRAAGQPARSNPALVAAVVVIGGLYLVGLATTDVRAFVSLITVAVLAYGGYRAYDYAVGHRAQESRLASRAEFENQTYVHGESSGFYGEYPPADPPQ
jgi:Protein of unknown function (DUF2510)